MARLTYINKQQSAFAISRGFYFHETLQMRSFAKIKSSRKFLNVQYLLSIPKPAPSYPATSSKSGFSLFFFGFGPFLPFPPFGGLSPLFSISSPDPAVHSEMFISFRSVFLVISLFRLNHFSKDFGFKRLRKYEGHLESSYM